MDDFTLPASGAAMNYQTGYGNPTFTGAPSPAFQQIPVQVQLLQQQQPQRTPSASHTSASAPHFSSVSPTTFPHPFPPSPAEVGLHPPPPPPPRPGAYGPPRVGSFSQPLPEHQQQYQPTPGLLHQQAGAHLLPLAHQPPTHRPPPFAVGGPAGMAYHALPAGVMPVSGTAGGGVMHAAMQPLQQPPPQMTGGIGTSPFLPLPRNLYATGDNGEWMGSPLRPWPAGSDADASPWHDAAPSSQFVSGPAYARLSATPAYSSAQPAPPPAVPMPLMQGLHQRPSSQQASPSQASPRLLQQSQLLSQTTLPSQAPPPAPARVFQPSAHPPQPLPERQMSMPAVPSQAPPPPPQASLFSTPSASSSNPTMRTPSIMQPPNSPASPERERDRISLLLLINGELLRELLRMQADGKAGGMPGQGPGQGQSPGPSPTDEAENAHAEPGASTLKAPPGTPSPSFYESMRCLQANLAYLAAVADRAHKPTAHIPAHPAIMTPPRSLPSMADLYQRLAFLFAGVTPPSMPSDQSRNNSTVATPSSTSKGPPLAVGLSAPAPPYPSPSGPTPSPPSGLADGHPSGPPSSAPLATAAGPAGVGQAEQNYKRWLEERGRGATGSHPGGGPAALPFHAPQMMTAATVNGAAMNHNDHVRMQGPGPGPIPSQMYGLHPGQPMPQGLRPEQQQQQPPQVTMIPSAGPNIAASAFLS
ncbi:MAG: hypothetical protein M1826_007615 [Phylliscum demangeonii]|nr:MAG: hypothetical protein M1826_007615 [Phylliscum demangeonii]